jgi:hypothetical protein
MLIQVNLGRVSLSLLDKSYFVGKEIFFPVFMQCFDFMQEDWSIFEQIDITGLDTVLATCFLQVLK